MSEQGINIGFLDCFPFTANRIEMTMVGTRATSYLSHACMRWLRETWGQIIAAKAEVMTNTHMRRSCFGVQRDGMVMIMDLG